MDQRRGEGATEADVELAAGLCLALDAAVLSGFDSFRALVVLPFHLRVATHRRTCNTEEELRHAVVPYLQDLQDGSVLSLHRNIGSVSRDDEGRIVVDTRILAEGRASTHSPVRLGTSPVPCRLVLDETPGGWKIRQLESEGNLDDDRSNRLIGVDLL